MSDVVRNYSGGIKPIRRHRRGHRGRSIALFVLVIVFMCVLWAVYATRDTASITSLVPQDQAYHIYVYNVLEKRGPILASSAWEVLSPDAPLADLRNKMASDLPMPTWMANNLLFGVFHVSGRDMTNFADALFVTKMSRVGCIIERFESAFGGMEKDHAGGLDLKIVSGDGIFYAVRGRVLVASASREAIIRALTLTKDRALAPEDFARGVSGAMERDVFATIRPAVDDPLGGAFRSLDVTLQVGSDGLALAAAGDLRPSFRERYADVLNPMAGGRAVVPEGGLVTVAADAGQPLPQFLMELDGLLKSQGSASPLTPLVTLLRAPAEGAAPLASLLPAFAATMTGPGWIQWQGAALNAMLPVPLFLGVFQAEEASVMTAMDRFREPVSGFSGDPFYVPRYDESLDLVHVPWIGGPDLEPSIAYREGRLLVSNSRLTLEAALAADLAEESSTSGANLRVRVQPGPAVETLHAMGRQLADAGVLRGFTADSFGVFAENWSRYASRMREISLALAHDQGHVKLRLDLAMVPAID